MNRKDGKPKIKKFKVCDKCNDSIGTFAYNRHYKACLGINKNLRKERKILGLDQLNISKIDENNYLCLECNKQYSKAGIGTHYWRNHTEVGKNFTANNDILHSHSKPAWNKGLTAETDERIKFYAEKCSISQKGRAGVPHTLESKKKLSLSMIKAHEEDRAWNIGKSRWNNKKSYPEKFFSEVIENEFLDKEYICEYPFYKYSLDFAWVSKKKVIEIDGEQHERFIDYKERDIKKDKLLIENNWKILRIKWKDLYNNTKSKIKEAYDFIHLD